MTATNSNDGIDLQAAAEQLEEASCMPVTLEQMAESLDYESNEWVSSRAPSPAAWVSLSKKLARADIAIGALTGLHQLARQHHFARIVARDQGVEYIGITDYQVSCIEDAIELLTWDAHYALNDLRTATKKGGA